MEKSYRTVQEFIEALEKQYTFAETAEIMGWLNKDEIVGGKIFCPFHAPSGMKRERTASCQVGDHFFKCYGCGAKGSIFNFGMLKENTSFHNTVNMVAQAIGVEIEDTKALSEQQKLFGQYRRQWDTMVKDMEEILKKRNGKLSETEKAIIRRYDALYPIESGYDKKNNRVIVPFTDINGRILGFSARAVLDSQSPKWKHDNVKYSLTRLCNNIFGLQNIKGNKEAYIVEGPGDISGMLRAGYSNTIAVCGCEHLNEQNIVFLSTMGINKITIVFDGDEAGRNGTIAACKTLLKVDYLIGKKSEVVVLKDNKDPGEYDKDELKELVENPIPVEEYLFENLVDSNDLRELYNISIQTVKNDIVNWVMKKYEVNKTEAYRILRAKKYSVEDDIKFLTEKDSSVGKEFGNISKGKANALLLRKYGIKVEE